MKSSMKLALSLTTCGLALMACSQSARASCSPEPYLGSVCYTATNYCPSPEYAEANGALLSISQNSTLFALLGTTYGGDGVTQFQLPNLQERLVIGQGPALPQGTQRGADSVQLTINQMPMHTHVAVQTTPPVTTVVVNASENTATSAVPTATANQLATTTGPAAKVYGANGGTQVALSGASAVTSGGTIGVSNTGSGLPFSIVPKETTLRACIAVRGVYPSRP